MGWRAYASWVYSFFLGVGWGKFIYLFWEREREREREAEREGERESQAGSTVSSEPDTGLHPMIMRSWPELKSRVRCLTDWATQAFILYGNVFQAPNHSLLYTNPSVIFSVLWWILEAAVLLRGSLMNSRMAEIKTKYKKKIQPLETIIYIKASFTCTCCSQIQWSTYNFKSNEHF